MSFDILGTGHFVPSRTVSNQELSTMMDTSDEWITKRIGVKQRQVCTTETTVDMGLAAAEAALENAGVKPEELDLILGTCITGDQVCPGLACMVQARLGATCLSADLASACSGFVFALDVAAGYFARGNVKKVLIVSSERMSGVVDWTDRSTACIFGDGAGAVVLGEGEGFKASSFYTRGGSDVLRVPVRSDKSPFYENELEEAAVFMNGQETYKFAVVTMAEQINKVMELAGLQGEDIAWVVPHQANYRIIKEARRRVAAIAPEKFGVNIDRYGNTSSASVPILLDEMNREGKLKRGDNIILTAFGGGLTSGACLVKW